MNRIVCILTLTLSAAVAQAQGLDGFIWGVNGHPGSGVYNEAVGIPLAEQMSWINNAGFGWYRMDVFADPANDELDAIVPAANAAGIKLYPTLHAPMSLRPFETLHTSMTPQQIYDTAYNAAYAAASKWAGQIEVWDLDNEFDGWSILSADHSGADLDHYDGNRIASAGTILKAQADAIRAADPAARISLNVGGWLHTGFVDHMIDADVEFDILSWHWYSSMGDITDVNGQNVLEDLLNYGKSVWIGESNSHPHPGGQPSHADDAWVTDFQRTLFAYRDRGVEAHFLYELFDEVNFGPDTIQSGFGLIGVEEDQGSMPVYTTGAPKRIFHRVRSVIQGSQRALATADTAVFRDDFDGGPAFDAGKWTASTGGTTPARFKVEDGLGRLVTAHDDTPSPSDAYLLSESFDLSQAQEWVVEVRFFVHAATAPVSRGLPTDDLGDPARQVHLISGVGDSGTGIRDFSVTLLQNAHDPSLVTLGWGSWLGPIDAILLDDDAEDLTRDRFHTLTLHHRDDGEIDFFLDGVYFATRSSLGGVPQRLLIGDLSSLTGVSLDLDYVSVGIVHPAPEPAALGVLLGASILLGGRQTRKAHP